MATLPKKPVKVAIYCRQSDLGKKAIAGMDKSLSLETQLAHCQAYCEQHGFLVVGTYSEQITEEVFDGRPALTRMIGTKIDAIICYKYDRII
jgi:DNA invertase Pin-like site-specific DNA recombinase